MPHNNALTRLRNTARAVITLGREAYGAVVAPPRSLIQGELSWDLQAIRAARQDQAQGYFQFPVEMARAFRTDDAMFVAYNARVSTQSSLQLCWKPSGTRRGKRAAERAAALVHTPQVVRQSLLGTLADHGISIGYVRCEPVGSEMAYTLTEWPLEFVRYNHATQQLETRVEGGARVQINHGDGRWVVFRKFGDKPWRYDAALLPGALLWAAHGFAISDWASASAAHGKPTIVGQLPEGSSLGTATEVNPDAQAFLTTLSQMMSGSQSAGVVPHGATTSMLYNGSTAWQVFKELVQNRESAAARIYLGSDALLGSRGGAPGVDISELFALATTRLQGDLEALERGFAEGIIAPWARAHGIAPQDTPKLEYLVPDPDADRRSEQEAVAITRLTTAITEMRAAGIDVTDEVLERLGKVTGVTVPLALGEPPEPETPQSESLRQTIARDPEAIAATILKHSR